jgi:hypothetical protein
MRRLLIALAILLLPSFAIAHGHGGGGGGHGGMGGGHGGMGGGHMAGGGWSGHGAASMAGARMGGSTGHMAAWNGGRMAAWNGRAGNWNRFHHGHFVHRHGRVFFVGGPWWWGGYGYSDYGCWQWVPTRWGPRRIWVCGDYY